MTKFTTANTRAAKLTNEQVYELRREYHEEGVTQSFLSRKYGVNINTVGKILRGETRQNVPQPLPAEDHEAAQRRLLEFQASQGVKVLEKLTSAAQKVYDKEIKPEKELERLKEGEKNA